MVCVQYGTILSPPPKGGAIPKMLQLAVSYSFISASDMRLRNVPPQSQSQSAIAECEPPQSPRLQSAIEATQKAQSQSQSTIAIAIRFCPIAIDVPCYCLSYHGTTVPVVPWYFLTMVLSYHGICYGICYHGICYHGTCYGICYHGICSGTVVP